MQNFKLRVRGQGKRHSYVYYPREEGKTMRIEVSHRDGGHNYFSGQSEARGIEVSVSMVERGAGVESFMPFDNCNARFFILEAPRYNKTKIERVANAMDEDLPKIVEAWERDVAAGKAMMFDAAKQAANAA